MTESSIGLIAGSGRFPAIFAQEAKAAGFAVYTIAFQDEADPALAEKVAAIEWLPIGQMQRLINFFKQHGIREAVMMGGINKLDAATGTQFDSTAISFLSRLTDTHDDSILRAFAEALEKEGIRILASTFLLPDLLAPKGCWTRRKPTAEEMQDVQIGWRAAKAIGQLDIGQCVVVAAGSVLAVEAIDGTDATILRGGNLGDGQAVVVKVCKPNQDMRFDIPAVGVHTVKTMRTAGAGVLAIEAGHAVAFDQRGMIGAANRSQISIIALEEGWSGN